MGKIIVAITTTIAALIILTSPSFAFRACNKTIKVGQSRVKAMNIIRSCMDLTVLGTQYIEEDGQATKTIVTVKKGRLSRPIIFQNGKVIAIGARERM